MTVRFWWGEAHKDQLVRKYLLLAEAAADRGDAVSLQQYIDVLERVWPDNANAHRFYTYLEQTYPNVGRQDYSDRDPRAWVDGHRPDEDDPYWH